MFIMLFLLFRFKVEKEKQVETSKEHFVTKKKTF